MGDKSLLSAEVQLSWEVMTCRGLRTTYEKESPCQWFNEHYGPYPAYTVDDLPVDVLKDGQSRSLSGICAGQRYNVPELMSGCRKAPIMSIGINPNLTSYQTSVAGATWCYPYFDNIAKYAHYFRYRTINQERFTVDFVKRYVVSGTEVRAENNGTIQNIARVLDTISISLKYDNSVMRTLRVPMNYSIFFDALNKNKNFKKGDILAGLVEMPSDVSTEVIQEPVGYYRQFNVILEKFKYLAGEELSKSSFQIGEDACQADMVFCASPGWNAYFPDITREAIVDECVRKRLYMAKQLLQSRPAIIVFAGSASLGMFLHVFGGKITPSVDPTEDTLSLLKKCMETSYFLQVATGEYSFKSRLIFSPHFSYSDNFLAGCRFTLKQWEEFVIMFPDEARLVESLKNDVYGGVILILNPFSSPWSEKLSAGAKKVLQPCYIDPVDIIAQVMFQEYQSGRIILDNQTQHLARSEGPCSYCGNELYRLKEGCPYGKLTIGADNNLSAARIASAAMSLMRK